MTRERRVRGIQVVRDLGPGPDSFLTPHRILARNRYADGTLSREYHTEFFDRRGFDAVAVAVYHERGGLHLGFVQGVRPAMILRAERPVASPEPAKPRFYMPEAMAGSLEREDRGLEGIRNRAVAEIFEETGFRVSASEIEPLGAGYFPSHGQCTEKIYLCAARVDPDRCEPKPGDGSVNEGDSLGMEFLPVCEFLARAYEGRHEDPKLEVLATRLAILKKAPPFESADPDGRLAAALRAHFLE